MVKIKAVAIHEFEMLLQVRNIIPNADGQALESLIFKPSHTNKKLSAASSSQLTPSLYIAL
jgi:hypothetical protein